MFHGFLAAPYLLKDLLPYEGVRYTRGSNLFRDAVADSHGPYVDKIESAGLVVLGKTNTPELTMSGETHNLIYGRTSNPIPQNF